MNLLQYILVSTVSLSSFYLVYLLLFRNDANFKQLRFYLLAAIFISLLLPFSGWEINLPQKSHEPGINQLKILLLLNQANDLNVEPTIIESETRPNIDYWHYAKLIYLAGIAIYLFRIFVQLITLAITFVRAQKKHDGSFTIVYNQHFKNTFSFFRWIYTPLNNETNPTEFATIIQHEKIHSAQYHSIDLVLIELLSAVMWFNPLVWKMKNSLQLVHEYLADEGALDTGIETSQYQALLINQLTEERLVSLSSSFNQSLLKKRMIMMTKSKFYHRSKLKILSIIPISALLLLAVALLNGLTPQKAYASEKNNVLTPENPTIIATPIKSDTSVVKVVGYGKKKDVTIDDFIKVKNEAIKIDPVLKNTTIIYDGKVIENINSIDQNDIESISVLKEEGKIIITSKQAAKASKKENSDEIKVVGFGTMKDLEGIVIGDEKAVRINPDLKNTTIIYDGKVIEDINTIDQEDIESISVLKEENKIIITSKGSKKQKFEIRAADLSDQNVMFIVNNKKMDVKTVESLNPDKIESITVLKDESKLIYAGAEDYDGVIVITTKEAREAKVGFQINATGPMLENILYIVDGKKMEGQDALKDINPDDIESISVLKDETMRKKYPEAKDKDGVIIVKLKK